jgi:hypothetical protein
MGGDPWHRPTDPMGGDPREPKMGGDPREPKGSMG